MIRIQQGLIGVEKEAIRQIFFASSSRQVFANAQEREQFFQAWTAFYFERCSESIFIALNMKNEAIAYLMGCEDSASGFLFFSDKNPSYLLFEDQFARYPAHFHINCIPRARGMGIGRLLVSNYLAKLRSEKVRGVHIVTAAEAENRLFYLKMGFDCEVHRAHRLHRLLLMGRDL